MYTIASKKEVGGDKMKKLKKNLPAMLEMFLTLTIVGLVYFNAARMDYRKTVDDTISNGHFVNANKTEAAGE